MFSSLPPLEYFLENSIHMTLFNKIKTGEPVIDTIISTLLIGIFSYFCSKFSKLITTLKEIEVDWIFRKNKIILDGKICTSSCNYSENVAMNSVYSDNFKAINNYIIKSIGKNNTIFHIREVYVPSKNYYEEENNKDLFIVDQQQKILLDKNKEIYVFTKTTKEDDDKDDKKKNSYSIENIQIEIFSYKVPLGEINKFVNKITEDYLINIEKNRKTKKYIYKLFRSPNEDISKYQCWMETEFNTTRNFNNLFFDNKKEVVNKIDFFLNNENWYLKTGMPYTLGIGLHGPPGTGKTSFIKALAKYTGRHVIILSLKLLKKRQYLEEFFFENQYNRLNKKNITFEKKIIVIEDIDCNDDIVLNRSFKLKEKKKSDSSYCNLNTEDVAKRVEEIKKIQNDDPITLDDILNLWDGIQETPGRILIISSNHYNKLDPALVRPGRIDISLELKNASHNVISDIYFYLFNKKIPKKKLINIKEFNYSPAQIINFYMQSNDNSEKFLKLMEIK